MNSESGLENIVVLDNTPVALATPADMAEAAASGEHIYNNLLTATDPFAPQPKKIKTALKPHQLAALGKAIALEQRGGYMYQDTLISENPYKISTNIGILGDQVGYGKTLTALAIVAATKPENFYKEKRVIRTEKSYSSHYIEETYLNDNGTSSITYLNTTLIIVPHGPVFTQWETALKTQTGLKFAAIDKIATIDKLLPFYSAKNATAETIRAGFNKFDIVLVKVTMLKHMLDRYYKFEDVINYWGRIMIDEAHMIINRVHRINFKFLWLITATYTDMFTSGTNYKSLSSEVYSVLGRIHMDTFKNLIRGDIDFVRSSFNVPLHIEHTYICKMPANINIHQIKPFINREVIALINANDFAGAIVAVGGKNGTETDIVKVITKESERSLHNCIKTRDYIMTLELPEETKTLRLKVANEAVAKAEERLRLIQDRVTALHDKQCPICYDTMTMPTVLEECAHSFCTKCIISWLRQKNSCPECRHIIDKTKVMAIVPENQIVAAKELTEESNRYAQYGYIDSRLEKLGQLLKLITAKPDGKFLVFSQYDASFYTMSKELSDNNITFGQMKGSSDQMMKTLQDFRKGALKVILLNTRFAGSGIDISCATDVVIFHSMGTSKIQSVGRAQRVGRTTPLVVHNLMYFNETPHANTSEQI